MVRTRVGGPRGDAVAEEPVAALSERVGEGVPRTQAGATLSALHHLGRTGATDAVVRRLAADLDDADKRQVLGVRRKVPAWLADVLDRVAAGTAQ